MAIVIPTLIGAGVGVLGGVQNLVTSIVDKPAKATALEFQPFTQEKPEETPTSPNIVQPVEQGAVGGLQAGQTQAWLNKANPSTTVNVGANVQKGAGMTLGGGQAASQTPAATNQPTSPYTTPLTGQPLQGQALPAAGGPMAPQGLQSPQGYSPWYSGGNTPNSGLATGALGSAGAPGYSWLPGQLTPQQLAALNSPYAAGAA